MNRHRYILVVNCGSSSIKFAVIEALSGLRLLSGLAERVNTQQAALTWSNAAGDKQYSDLPFADYNTVLDTVMVLLQEAGLAEKIQGIGHRVVHGGEKFIGATWIDDAVIAEIKACVHLAPLHNPSNLEGIAAAQHAFPDLPQIAVFDTAFHQTMPKKAYLYALPQRFYYENAVRRYGFHGISYSYVSGQAIKALGLKSEDNAFLIAHLGNGCSATAVLNGHSVDTTMGMTPLEGLMMGTRSGDIDPGLHAYLAAECGFSLEELTSLLNKQSGLLGVSNISMDMRTLERAAEAGNADAQLAIDMFCYRLAKSLGALATTLPRIDALLFTGGIGENAAFIRAKVLQQLHLLGFELSEQDNKEHGKKTNGFITRPGSTVAMVIPTNEELMIAREVEKKLA